MEGRLGCVDLQLAVICIATAASSSADFVILTFSNYVCSKFQFCLSCFLRNREFSAPNFVFWTKIFRHTKIGEEAIANCLLPTCIVLSDISLRVWAKKVSYCTLSTSWLNIDQFSQFFHQWTL